MAATHANTAATTQTRIVEREPSATTRTYEAPGYAWELKVTGP
jgi:hypothetical protein